MSNTKKIIYYFALIPVVLILMLFVWFFTIIFEGEKPTISFQPLPEFLSESRKFTLNISDMKRGLKRLKVSLSQEGREITVLEKKFQFIGFLNCDGVHVFDTEFIIDPLKLKLSQGRLDLNVSVWDFSRRGGGDGNMTLIHHKMIIDTISPAIRAISRMHNINKGGSCLVVYQTSSDTQESGLFVNNLFFPGFPAGGETEQGIYSCYFAIPYDSTLNPSIYLWAKDRAGNQAKSSFYHHIRRKRFRKEKMDITDKFLDHILPYFSFYPLDALESNIAKFLKINNELRKENHKTLLALRQKTDPKKLWEGRWLRLKNSATKARFADHRSYYYNGQKVDEQIHLGIDLASLANAPVQAANHGRVIFADRLGIYGLTVVLDHGQGLTSMYGHLSKIEMSVDQNVKKGDIIGFTGRTGLAGGDHLHFSIMVNSIFVNPIEWWDSHWINDNITKRMILIKK
ncbi:MAG: M23 family metallopeptidase [Thermodesulfobacteriota bacterium]|nr:M23 family metallopeptidase [Thermodesulfobacteriota bacterium]